MNVFVLDQDTADDRRDWNKMLGFAFSRITYDEESGFRCDGKAVSWGPGVILVHQGGSSALKAAENILAAQTGLSVVVVSASPQTKASTIQRFYFRKSPVGRPNDVIFPSYLKQFLDDLENSNGERPNFELLEPTAVPAPLLAYTIAVQYRLNLPNIRELTTAADTCYGQIQPYAELLLSKPERGTISSPEVRVPSRAAFESETPGDPNGTRFKAMRNVIELLREDL